VGIVYLNIQKSFVFWQITRYCYILQPPTCRVLQLLKEGYIFLHHFGNFPFAQHVCSSIPAAPGVYTDKPVYKGHSREPENVTFMSKCPLYKG